MNKEFTALNIAWQEWNTNVKPFFPLRFGQYFINTYAKDGYTNADIFHETNTELAYHKVFLAIEAGELQIK